MLAVSLVTLGSPSQLTGGYLYHRRMADAAAAHDVEFRFVSFPEHPFPLAALWGRRVLAEAGAADVVLVDSIAAAYVAPAMPRRQPLVAVVHQTFGGIDHGPLRTAVQAPLDRRVYTRATRVIAASEALAGELAGGGVARERLEVVAPGRDLAVPELPLPDLRLGRRVAFLAVGNWVERKGILDLIDAFARLPPGAATLHLVGRADVDRGYASQVHARLARSEVSGRVVVHGPLRRERVATLMAAADAFVLPSLREPYGTVYGEALALGCPVVGWRAGNLPYLADDGKEGILVPPGDVDALAGGLERLATDVAFLERLREGAAARGRSLPTWEHSAARFFEIVKEVAGTAR
jgi:glycosyltransferase involved in cell wall biosynthesis